MSVAEFAYAQARIEARHGERLQDADWKTLESAAVPVALSRARPLDLAQAFPRADRPATCRRTRSSASCGARRRFTPSEIATWAPRRWRPAIAWIAALPLLPLAERSARALRCRAAGRRRRGARPLACRRGPRQPTRSPRGLAAASRRRRGARRNRAPLASPLARALAAGRRPPAPTSAASSSRRDALSLPPEDRRRRRAARRSAATSFGR